MSDKYGYIGIETLLSFCENSKDHAMTPNDFMRMKRVRELKPQWIPCNERLPDNNRQVLVYARSVHFALAKYDEMREADGTYKMQWVTFDAWKPFYKIKDVIAWMPLPEPYKAERRTDG